jgi:hypothetical protein
VYNPVSSMFLPSARVRTKSSEHQLGRELSEAATA